MAGMEFTAPDLGSVSNEALGRILREAANAVLSTAQLSFISASTPNGIPWPRLAKATVAKRRNGSDSPLRDTGRLLNSLMVSEPYAADGGLAIDAGSNVEYSALHNFGGMAGRGRKVRIPSRQFMPDPDNMPEDLASELLDIAAKHVARELGR